MPISIIVHAGAWTIPDELLEPSRAACRQAVEVGWAILAAGGAAVDAAQAAVESLERDPLIDSGVGAQLNRDGVVELDAAIMDGARVKFGSVAAVRRSKSPVGIARALLEADVGEPSILVGEGAERFAAERGLPLCDPVELIGDAARQFWRERVADQPVGAARAGHDTVGACAIDHAGNLAAAISTGGTPFKRAGRIGDSPLPGCGFWADNRLGAAVATGVGEALMRVTMARTTLTHLARLGDPFAAAQAAVDELHELTHAEGGAGGVILLDREGRPGWFTSTAHLAFGYRTEADAEPVAMFFLGA